MTLRICNFYPDFRLVGRNDGNPMYLTNILRKMGHEVKHIFPKGGYKGDGKFDLYLWADWGEDALGMTDFVCPKPNAYWASDTHLGFSYRLKKAHEFDHVFCAQKKAAEQFKESGIKNAQWLPHAVEPAAYFPHVCLSKYDVCFVGNINDESRARFFDRVFKEFPNFWFGKRTFEDAAEKYCQSKIVVNHAINDDTNMRVFEALASKSFLLTPKVSNLEELFKDGEHLIMYENIDDFVEKAKYYLKEDEKRQKIAEAGYREVLKNHTFRHRADTILDTCGLKEKIK